MIALFVLQHTLVFQKPKSVGARRQACQETKIVTRTNSHAGDSKALITSSSFVPLKLKSSDRGQSSANFSSSILNSVLLRKFEVSGHSYIFKSCQRRNIELVISMQAYLCTSTSDPPSSASETPRWEARSQNAGS